MSGEGLIPFCHGEPMQPVYRYKDNGILYHTFLCNFCNRKEEVEDSTAGQEILKKRLERGDIEEQGLLYTKRGFNK